MWLKTNVSFKDHSPPLAPCSVPWSILAVSSLPRMHVPQLTFRPSDLPFCPPLLRCNGHTIRSRHFKVYTLVSSVRHTQEGVTVATINSEDNHCPPGKSPLLPCKPFPPHVLPYGPWLCFLSPQMPLLERHRNENVHHTAFVSSFFGSGCF